MFKSIEFLKLDAFKYEYIFHLIDDDFECKINSYMPGESAPVLTAMMEYHNRGLDIVKNLYLANLYIAKNWYNNAYTFHDLIAYQEPYFEEHFKPLSTDKDIFVEAISLYETLNVFK